MKYTNWVNMTSSTEDEKQVKEKKSHKIGYARVSTEDQNLELQMDALLAAELIRATSTKRKAALPARSGRIRSHVERPALRRHARCLANNAPISLQPPAMSQSDRILL
jgi:Resolvase, N terminal domain